MTPSDSFRTGLPPVGTDMGATAALAALWQAMGLPRQALAAIDLPGRAPVLPSSFAVATAAQASLGAAALAAATLWVRSTGERQQLVVDREAATLECSGLFSLDGQVPALWDPLSGLYPCGAALGEPGWVRVHANFAHHRDGALRLLGCPTGIATTREQVAAALRHWRAEAFETAAAEAGVVAAAVRRHDDWLAHPQAQAVAQAPLVRLTRLGDAPPLAWHSGRVEDWPLDGLRVLDLTRILAGPVAGRTLAAYGAEVMLVNGPHLPNIEAIVDTSRGKRSALLDLRLANDRALLGDLVRGAHVWLQAYRPDSLTTRGFSPKVLAAMRPGLVVASLSAYGGEGPWRGRRGFDSLVQTATGLNLDEAAAFGEQQPRALPVQILDYSAGYLLAFGIQAALWRQQTEGGSWQVEVSLAGVAGWLRQLGRVPDGPRLAKPDLASRLQACPSGWGALACLPHAVQWSRTPARWRSVSLRPGSDAPLWRARSEAAR